MKSSCSTKMIATFLCLIMIIGVLPINSFAINYEDHEDFYLKLVSKRDWELAPGIVESEMVLSKKDGSHRQVCHVVEVDINNPYTKVMPSSYKMAEGLENKDYSTQVMSKQAKYAEEHGYGNVVAAMNLSLHWYDTDYYKEHPELIGEPLGYLFMDGVQYSNSQDKTFGAQTCLVINFDEKDGVPRPDDIPKTQIRWTSWGITGWEEQVIPANFFPLLYDGVNPVGPDDITEPAPRSCVGVKADGSIIMVMNDGRQSPYSTGMNLYEMGEFMRSLGCVWATNGDGGGSSTFLSQRPGEELELHCSPSDGSERPTTHGILVISSAPADGEFANATVKSEADYYTPGSEVQFSASGFDLDGSPADIPSNAVWQLKDSSFGAITNGLFVSNGKEGEVTVQLSVNGEVVGEDTVFITKPDALSFVSKKIAVPFGEKVKLALSATYQENNVILQDSDITLTLLDSSIGTLSGMYFTAGSYSTSKNTILTANVCGISAMADLSIGKGAELIYSFEVDGIETEWTVPEGWSIQSNIGDENGNIYVVKRGSGKVKYGDYALAVACDFSQIYINGRHALTLNFPEIECNDAIKIGFWMYIPYDARYAQLMVGGTDIELFGLQEGWHYITAPVNDGKISAITIAATGDSDGQYDSTTEANLNGKYIFYIDEITLEYSDAVSDHDAPVFSTPVVVNSDNGTRNIINGQTIEFNKMSFEVLVADSEVFSNTSGLMENTAQAFVDGVEVKCIYRKGKILIPDITLNDGVHSVKFQIEDKKENVAWISASFYVDSGISAPDIKIIPRNLNTDRLLIGSLYWMDVVATDLETIEQIKLVFDLNNASYWELEGMVLADGFTATYAVQYDDNIATVIITRTDDNMETGVATLASIPVRTWISDGTKIPADLVANGNIWAQSIEISLEMGAIDYVDTYKNTNLGTFGMDNILVDTELFFNGEFKDSVEGAKEWISACINAGIGFHEHTIQQVTDKAPNCTQPGYAHRTVCDVCNSVVDWGITQDILAHNYQFVNGKLICTVGGELFNGVYIDGITYYDGIPAVDGWVEIDGVKTYYYKDGVKLVGSHFFDDVIHTFDNDGVYLSDYVFDGFYEINNTVMYFISNKYLTGVQKIANKLYYFDNRGLGYDGEYILCGETCVFDNGQYVSCNTASLYDAGWCGEKVEYVVYTNGTLKLGGSGSTYQYSNHGNRPFINCLKIINKVYVGKDITILNLNIFSFLLAKEIVFEEGSVLVNISTGAFHSMPYLKEINIPNGVTSIGAIAFKNSTGLRKINIPTSVKNIANTAFNGCSVAMVLYVTPSSVAESFAVANNLRYSNESYLLNGFYEEGGEIYFYVDGIKWTRRGVFQVDSDYYYAKSGGALVRNQKIYASVTNDLVPFDMYEFDEDGKMVIDIKNGFVEENGEIYYYVNGVRWTRRGVFQAGNDFYYAKSGGALLRNTRGWASITNGLIVKAIYDFDVDGKIIL